jgi:hypothetical protein
MTPGYKLITKMEIFSIVVTTVDSLKNEDANWDL